MRKLKIAAVIIVFLSLGLYGIKSYNASRLHLEEETRVTMDTYVTIHAIGPKETTSKAISLAFGRMQEINAKFNSLNPKSPIYAFNHKSITIADPEILELIRLAIKVSRESEGAFDITVAPLVELWGFYEKAPRLPRQEEIDAALKNVGYRYLYFDNGELKKTIKDVRIDLGGIAKGYAISEAAKVLKQNGVSCALIDAGGDIYALGKRGVRFWKVGIKDPRREGILGYVEVEDLAVLSSGDYERFFIRDGKRYHHIFNPKTGYPTEGLSSVTLIYYDPVVAQAWAKIPFILGAKKGLEMLEKIPGMEAIIITASGEKLYSPSSKHIVKLIPEAK